MLALIPLAFVVVVGAGPTPGAAQPEPDPWSAAETLDLQGLIEEILARNQGLTAARAALAATEAARPRAGVLEDPMVSYGIAPASLGTGLLFGQELRASQAMPWPGKLRWAGEMAAAEAEMAGLEVDALARELAAMASRLYADLYQADRELAINARHLELLSEFQTIATGRYGAGLAAQSEPLQAEVELAHSRHRRVELETERTLATARLNTLLHRLPAAPLPPPPAELPGLEAGGLETEKLMVEAVAARPELLASETEIRRRRAALELTSLEKRPDLDLMASYNSMWSDREHRFMIGVAVNLPLRKSRWRSAEAEAEARLAEAEARSVSLADAVRLEVRSALARIDESHHLLELYRSRLLPAAGDQIQAALAAYRTGTTSALAVIEAERSLRDAEIGYHATLASLYRGVAELDRSLGRLPAGVAVALSSLEPGSPEGALP